jgi:hypothetical protein
MTQRMQGMANINAMERQRQADALALEDRAAAQKKAQEDEVVKSLLPAYAHVFKTGDLDGGLSLAPPEYQSYLAQYADALRGKPLEEIQAALAGSLVTSDAGRAFLENYNRMTTAGIQLGQLDVSKGNLALAQQAAEREASAGNKVVQWIQNDDGTATGLDAYGNIVKTVPGIGKKTAVTGPNGVKLGPGEVLDPETQTVKLVPGTKAYNAASKVHSSDNKDAAIVLDKTAAANKKLDYILDPKNKDGFEYNFGGYWAAYVGQNAPVESAQNMYAKLESLKADLSGAGLEQIRAGGSIGAITEAEWPMIQKGEKEARTALENLRRRLNNIAERAKEAYDMQWGETQFYSPIKAKTFDGNSGANSSSGRDTNGDGVIDYNDL